MTLRWDDLRVFLCVVRAGTLGGAASQLGIDASTVFRRIVALEKVLGSRVFDRRGRPWALTAAGERLVEHAGRIEDEMLAVQREVLGRDVVLAGTIRVTTSDDLGVRLVPAHLAAFRQRHPAIGVELILDNRILDLGRGEADVAIRPRPPPPSGSIVGRKISELAGALYASAEYVELHGRPRKRRDLIRHAIVAGEGSLATTPYGQLAVRYATAERVALRSNSLLAVSRAIALGVGIGVLPCFLGDGEGLLRLFPPEPELAGGLWLLYHGDLRQTARVRAFSDFIFESIRSQGALLEGRASIEKPS